MLQIVLYQNTNQQIKEAYGKWFLRVVNNETIDLEGLAEHMSAAARTTRAKDWGKKWDEKWV